MSLLKRICFTSVVTTVISMNVFYVHAADLCSVEGLQAAKETFQVKEKREQLEEFYQLVSTTNSTSAGGSYGPSSIDYNKSYANLSESERTAFEKYFLEDSSVKFSDKALQYLTAVCAEQPKPGLLLSVKDDYSTLYATINMRFVASDVGAQWEVKWDQLAQYNLDCPKVDSDDMFVTANGVTLNCKIGRAGMEDGKRQRYNFRLPTKQGNSPCSV